LTIFLGRFFCGWVCPFGALHQAIGFLHNRRQSITIRLGANRYRKSQKIKYGLLIFLLSGAAGELLSWLAGIPWHQTTAFVVGGILVLAGSLSAIAMNKGGNRKKIVIPIVIAGLAWLLLGMIFKGERILVASLQTGLLDPLPLLHRSVNLALLPLAAHGELQQSAAARYYEGAWLIGVIFGTALCMNLWIPRFYCRYVCPLGALLGYLGRWAIWRVGKRETACQDCRLCEKNCEGACQPASRIRISECVLCLNCLDDCHHGYVGYRTQPSAAGEVTGPDLSKREFVTAFAGGTALVALLRLNGIAGPNRQPDLVRPPGALAEAAFLSRCTKCGQCMRICPTNVIQPDGLTGGLESLWTPVLNFRIGSSGCQVNCIACGHVCPTAAIRPLDLDERLGRGRYVEDGPVRIGTAFVDRGRCLPWAMDRPCIVCQENCPVSPKAIYTREHFSLIRMDIPLRARPLDANQLQLTAGRLTGGQMATGDYYVRIDGQPLTSRRRIIANTADSITLMPSPKGGFSPGDDQSLVVEIKLQRPWVDPKRCIGCGICEHECPVKGLRAIRVTSENESRSRENGFLL
jgi:polyferredoxin